MAGYAKDDASLDEDEKAFLSAKSSQLFFTVLDMIVEVGVVYSGGAFDSLFIGSIALAGTQRSPPGFYQPLL